MCSFCWPPQVEERVEMGSYGRTNGGTGERPKGREKPPYSFPLMSCPGHFGFLTKGVYEQGFFQ